MNNLEKFEYRHIGPDRAEIDEMLQTVGADSLEDLVQQTIPASIRLDQELVLPAAKTEYQFLHDFKKIAQKNKTFKSYIGLGYYNCITPSVVQRNILENPGWYTAYTPYQAEIAQGRLEALINFQTMVIDLTAMEIANASLLDEGTAAAEAMSMLAGLRRGSKKSAFKFFVDKNLFPQTIDILKTRALPLGIELLIDDPDNIDLQEADLFGLILQYPNADGNIQDYTSLIHEAKENGVYTAVAADLLALTLLKPPGEMGADVVVGTTQRFGVPLGFGGPHAAYLATREAYKRNIPGRIIGVSIDQEGNKAYRMALQTREQHIKREKATSNICTAQVLLAVMAGMYAVYHGAEGLKNIAQRIHRLTRLLEEGLHFMGLKQMNTAYFDTLKIDANNQLSKDKIRQTAIKAGVNFRFFDGHYVGISLDETTGLDDVFDILTVFATAFNKDISAFDNQSFNTEKVQLSPALRRDSAYLTHAVFSSYRSEHQMLRYIKALENKDLSLVHSMISLGSCTMKLNATTEMLPISWPEIYNIHPFAPTEQVGGYLQIFSELESWLNEITGFEATSLQPNSGAQGEFAGLMVIRAYHQSKGEDHRNIALIPSSAHGTNPASATMAGMKVVIVQCDEKGNVDVEDLKDKALKYQHELSALMITYPSTHGVFEEPIKTVCQIIHDCGGQVYMDGANMNAQIGLTSPAMIGADVCHLNLHKTFCIPHGGGGPGIGPICVAAHLKEFLPGNPFIKTGGEQAISAISAAPWGSASILTISYAYIVMMGADGLTNATKLSILNANYLKERLSKYYPILYTGIHDRCAHEMIVDCRAFKKVGVEVEDIAKRLMDYGFHAPTVSFPVAGTMMIEPTESESKKELDLFCDALIEIRSEIEEVEQGLADKTNNVLKNAPHTASVALSDEWSYPYSRKKAVFPLPYVEKNKFWPSTGRIDSAYGDRNLMCSCIPIEDYEIEEAAT